MCIAPLQVKGAGNFLNSISFLNIKCFCFNRLTILVTVTVTTDLRWLLRRGSPLPISNREVKPASADGTAILWESMSLPFFIKPRFVRIGVFCFGVACRKLDSLPFLEVLLKSEDFLFCGKC